MNTIHSILIANRGEIARRIIQTCKRLGIRSIAVYAKPDEKMPFVSEADEAIALDGNTAAETYLAADKIIAAAKRAGAQAIHPGYGFLSENAVFARRCAKENLVFIGPNPKAIEKMGLKSTAKAIMEAHEVPVIQGYKGDDQRAKTLIKEAEKIGFPVLLKAVAGGGGKGMRIARSSKEIQKAIEAAKREAHNSFGNDKLMIERYFPSARHIEFQILGDQHGNVWHLYERECTIQRRYQKIIEESPSPSLDDKQRQAMAEAAIRAAKAINYDNAGTVEFIVDEQGEFFFLEVNTRLQVEHPVTEMITGLDLVELQIQAAEGRKIDLTQAAIQQNGYAVECRLYAEDPQNDFMPATGIVKHWQVADLEGLRYDTGIDANNEISVYFDPMIAKIIAHGSSRSEGMRRMHYALQQLQCLGLTTNQRFLIALFNDAKVLAGDYDTHFLDRDFDFEQLKVQQQLGEKLAMIAILLYRWHQRQAQRKLIPDLLAGWRNNPYQPQQETYLTAEEEHLVEYTYKGKQDFEVRLAEKKHEVRLISVKPNALTIRVDGQHHSFSLVNDNDVYYLHHQHYGQLSLKLKPRFPDLAEAQQEGSYQAPMPGEILKVWVQAGDEVKAGDNLVTLLSMKMENTIAAYEDGIVEAVFVEAGETIEAGTNLLELGK